MTKNLIIGDVHGCGDELEDLISQTHQDHNLICIGDLFDRAPQGVKVWELIQKYNITCLLGNHEIKMLSFLKKERDWLPPNYYHFLNAFSEKYHLIGLVDFLERLPRLLDLGSCIAVHAAVDVTSPLSEDKGINCYGYKNDLWPNNYKGEQLVVYGHKVFQPPLVKLNSIGIDTAACNGGCLTGYCPEDAKFYTAKSKSDYFTSIKGVRIEPNDTVLNFRSVPQGTLQ